MTVYVRSQRLNQRAQVTLNASRFQVANGTTPDHDSADLHTTWASPLGTVQKVDRTKSAMLLTKAGVEQGKTGVMCRILSHAPNDGRSASARSTIEIKPA